jgi:hypothetical protein
MIDEGLSSRDKNGDIAGTVAFLTENELGALR